MMLSPDQERAFKAATNGGNVFITGPGGTGKSFLVHEIVEALRFDGKHVKVTASTGIAAINVGGSTIHKYLGTGIAGSVADAKKWYDRMSTNFHRGIGTRIGKADVLVIDEVSMLSGDFLNMTSAWLRKFRDESKPFGGLQVIMVGDFMQLPPVDPKRQNVEPFAFMAAAWSKANIRTCTLTTPHRQADPRFVAALNRLRFGQLTEGDAKMFVACVGRKLTDPTELLATNDEVDSVNAAGLAALAGELITIDADVRTGPSLTPAKAAKARENLLKSCITPERLELKVGAPVLMTVNDPSGRFVNGTRATVVSIQTSLHVQDSALQGSRAVAGSTVTVKIDGEDHIVDPHRWKALDGNDRIEASMLQLPVRLAWALTIHKSQGLTLDPYKANLARCFAAGQAYVALSRAKRIRGLELASPLHPDQVFADARLVKFYDTSKGDVA